MSENYFSSVCYYKLVSMSMLLYKSPYQSVKPLSLNKQYTMILARKVRLYIKLTGNTILHYRKVCLLAVSLLYHVCLPCNKTVKHIWVVFFHMGHYYRWASTLVTAYAISPCLDHVMRLLWTSRQRLTWASPADGCSVSTTCLWRRGAVTQKVRNSYNETIIIISSVLPPT